MFCYSNAKLTDTAFILLIFNKIIKFSIFFSFIFVCLFLFLLFAVLGIELEAELAIAFSLTLEP
jgi:hypothetical protein